MTQEEERAGYENLTSRIHFSYCSAKTPHCLYTNGWRRNLSYVACETIDSAVTCWAVVSRSEWIMSVHSIGFFRFNVNKSVACLFGVFSVWKANTISSHFSRSGCFVFWCGICVFSYGRGHTHMSNNVVLHALFVFAFRPVIHRWIINLP